MVILLEIFLGLIIVALLSIFKPGLKAREKRESEAVLRNVQEEREHRKECVQKLKQVFTELDGTRR